MGSYRKGESMDVIKLKQRKRVLEKQIIACIEEFERDTTLSVTAIQVVNQHTISSSSRVFDIQAEVKI
jgi:hypothetical protein